MRVTVCELPDSRTQFPRAWQKLTEHVAQERSDFVLLPAMPFYPWFAATRTADARVWNDALRAHDAWERQLKELSPAAVASTRPVDFGNERYEEAFVWNEVLGFRSVHAKSMLRNDPGYREASWYHEAVPEFVPQELNGVTVGFLIDAELGWLEEAARYGAEGVELLLVPRCAAPDSRWLEAARRTAVVSGTHQLSSNRSESRRFGGEGWIIDPEGTVLGRTTLQRPFLTLELDLPTNIAARSTVNRGAASRPKPW
jgi:N-carbamoylputrescine amidase